MDTKTEKALRESIAHWERMRDGKRINQETPQGKYCSLCKLFYRRDELRQCEGCPVRRKTSHDTCLNTPWEAANVAFNLVGPDSGIFKDAAAKMVDFLKSLLPQ